MFQNLLLLNEACLNYFAGNIFGRKIKIRITYLILQKNNKLSSGYYHPLLWAINIGYFKLIISASAMLGLNQRDTAPLLYAPATIKVCCF